MFEKTEVANFLELWTEKTNEAVEQWLANLNTVNEFWTDLYKKYVEVVTRCPMDGTVLFGLVKEFEQKELKNWFEKPMAVFVTGLQVEQPKVVAQKEEKSALVTPKVKTEDVKKAEKPVVEQPKVVVKAPVVKEAPTEKKESVLSALVQAVKDKPVVKKEVAKKPAVKKPVAAKKAPVKTVEATPASEKLVKDTEKKVAVKRVEPKPVEVKPAVVAPVEVKVEAPVVKEEPKKAAE